MLKFLVKQQRIETLESDIIASGQIQFVTVKFIFDGKWRELHKVVQFTQCDETYNLVLGTDGMSCKLPSELHLGTVKMSVFGYGKDNTEALRATTVPITLHIRPSGFVGDGDAPIPPTPDLYQQLLQQIDEKIKDIQSGIDGREIELRKSDTAIEWHYKGDSEWSSLIAVDELKGDKGDDGYTMEDIEEVSHVEIDNIMNLDAPPGSGDSDNKIATDED